MINISFLEIPLKESMNDNKPLSEKMYLTAKPLYKNKNIHFENLHRIVKSNFRQYSPFVFENGLKKSENWNNNNQNLLILDIDDGLTITEAKEKFKDYKYLICTTKSHQKDKKGIVCDRFRVILKAINVPQGDEYFEYIKNLEFMYPFIDKQVNTKTGAFLGYSDCEYWYNKGKEFDFSILKPIQVKKPQKNNFKAHTRQKVEYTDSLPIQEIKNRLTRELIADIVSSRGFEVNSKFMFKYRQDERTPSASISPDGLVKDFGSELSTDAIGFIQEVDKVDFKTAVEIVGAFANVQTT